MESTFEGGAKVTPISSIPTIDDLITSLLKVGYKKEVEFTGKNRTFYINHCVNEKIPLINCIITPTHMDNWDDVFEQGDICFGAFVNAKTYPYIKHWEVHEALGGGRQVLTWELLERYNIEELDEILKGKEFNWIFPERREPSKWRFLDGK